MKLCAWCTFELITEYIKSYWNAVSAAGVLLTGSSDRALAMKCQSGNIIPSSVVAFLPHFGTSVRICLLSPWGSHPISCLTSWSCYFKDSFFFHSAKNEWYIIKQNSLGAGRDCDIFTRFISCRWWEDINCPHRGKMALDTCELGDSLVTGWAFNVGFLKIPLLEDMFIKRGREGSIDRLPSAGVQTRDWTPNLGMCPDPGWNLPMYGPML